MLSKKRTRMDDLNFLLIEFVFFKFPTFKMWEISGGILTDNMELFD